MPDANIDSLLHLRKGVFLDGQVKTYYSSSSKEMALKLKGLLEEMNTYYVEKYKKPFTIKLAVLDSSEWVTELAPWRWNFFNNGWAIMGASTDISFYFSDEQKYLLPQFIQLLKEKNINQKEFIYAMSAIIALHESGHYYIMKKNGIAPSGCWFNEIAANCFYYNFLKHKGLNYFEIIKPYNLFLIENSKPIYTDLKTRDTSYAKMPETNYIWFSTITDMFPEKFYKEKGDTFLTYILNKYSGKKPAEIDLDESINDFDVFFDGKLKKWIADWYKK